MAPTSYVSQLASWSRWDQHVPDVHGPLPVVLKRADWAEWLRARSGRAAVSTLPEANGQGPHERGLGEAVIAAMSANDPLRKLPRLDLVEVTAVFRQLLLDPGFHVVAENLHALDVRFLDGKPREIYVRHFRAGEIDVVEDSVGE